MLIDKTNRTKVAILLISGLILTLTAGVSAQQPAATQKPKMKDFGSSIKKLKNKDKDNSKDDKTKNDNVSDDVIQVKTNLVVSDTLVINEKGNVILGLKKNDFIVTEDGVPQEIGIFGTGNSDDIPRSIVLILDYSGSLIPYLHNSLEAARSLVDTLNPRDRMAIVTDDIKLISEFTTDKAALKNTSVNDNTERNLEWADKTKLLNKEPSILFPIIAITNHER